MGCCFGKQSDRAGAYRLEVRPGTLEWESQGGWAHRQRDGAYTRPQLRIPYVDMPSGTKHAL